MMRRGGAEHRAEQRADARGTRPDDEQRILLRNLGDAGGPEACGEDVAGEERRLVAHRVGNARQPLLGVGYAHVFGLSAVDAASERPAPVGVGAVVDVAVAAEETLAAEGLDVDRHAVARAERRDAGADLLDDAHHLVADGNALDGARHAAVEDVQVAGADARQRDAHQCVARVFEAGQGLFAELEASAADIGAGFHGSAMCSFGQR